MSDEQRDPARSFGGVADAYDRGRPSYPLKAAAWLTSDQPVTVLELGAGTGKLTSQLVALGHDVHATDPDPAMLALLERNLPEVRVSRAPAEEIPAGDRSYDVVVCAQAFHWFDLDHALPEIARVLKPRGRLALVWNERDERIPWVRRLGAIIGTQEQLTDPTEVLEGSALFGEVERTTFGSRQLVDRDSIQDLVRSRSNVATLGEADRAAKLRDAVELYDEYGRGMDGMQLPYVVSCFRAAVLEQASFGLPAAEGPAADASDGSATDMLLIDFR
jgi:ubiquinone/menaquinone biosynthesis C-methylase UbiE